jgi:hypothetical protein
LHKTNGIYRPTKEEINDWTNKLKDVQNWYENRGIKFIIAIVPNKHTVYKDKLPHWMEYHGKTITDDIVEQSNAKGINLLDLRNKFIEPIKNSEILYNKQGSHWNSKGSAVGFEAIMNQLSLIYDLNLTLPKYEFNDFKTHGDSMWLFLKIKDLLKLSDYDNEFEFSNLNQMMCLGNINLKNGLLENCTNVNNPKMSINGKPQYIINNMPLNNLKLLLLCDSFATANSKLFNISFERVWKWHYQHLTDLRLVDFVNKNQPDVVIYQVVERDLYNSYVVKKLNIALCEEIIPDNINDNNWQLGVFKDTQNMFVVRADDCSLLELKKGTKVNFNTGIRKIMNIEQNGVYTNITVDGEKLDPVKDGYPNKIKLIKKEQK